ncbi:hypothetical protein D3C81_2102620 [compost metagenome]
MSTLSNRKKIPPSARKSRKAAFEADPKLFLLQKILERRQQFLERAADFLRLSRIKHLA